MKFECDVCGESKFNTQAALSAHRRWKHPGASTVAPKPSVSLAVRETAPNLANTQPEENSVLELKQAIQALKEQTAKLSYEKAKFEKQANLLAELVTQLVDRVAMAEARA